MYKYFTLPPITNYDRFYMFNLRHWGKWSIYYDCMLWGYDELFPDITKLDCAPYLMRLWCNQLRIQLCRSDEHAGLWLSKNTHQIKK